jgi:hypothetical protein
MNYNLSDIIKHLQSSADQFEKIKVFSNEPGIYAVSFCGESFPFAGYKPKKNEIIYVGKTESSQQSRDADTHFASGRTGTSTLRRTFGALLLEELKLKPLPRSQTDIEAGRTSFYKFNDESEIKLTSWMRKNLALAFYPYAKSAIDIDSLETQIIQALIPILNIDKKNPANLYTGAIKALRKKTALIAHKFTGITQMPTERMTVPESQKTIKRINVSFAGSIFKYEDIWKQLRSAIIETIHAGNDKQIYIGETPFKKVGNRQSYSFNLEFKDGRVSNNIGGSAVARDLARILERSNDFIAAAKGKWVKITLDRYYQLNIRTSII